MSRLVLDAVNFKAVAATRWPHLVGYVNGRVSAWTPAEISAVRAEGHLLALVDVLGTAPREASILDFERGDVQSPAVVREWVRARNQFAGDATVYVQPGSIGRAVSQLRGEPCFLWVVDLTSDGEPPFTTPHYPDQPSNVVVIARQFVFGPRSGGDYDMSIWYRDEWHPEQLAPAHLFAARAAAVAELGPYQNASSAAELTDPRTGQITAAPLHVATLAEPFGATLPCAWCPGPVTCATANRCLEPDGEAAAAAASSSTAAPVDQAAAAVDQAAAELAGAALVVSTAPSSPTPASSSSTAAAAPAFPRIAPYVAGSGSSPAPVDQECGDSPGGMGWPVCSLPPHGADVNHESADLQWPDGATTPVAKASGHVPAWPDSASSSSAPGPATVADGAAEFFADVASERAGPGTAGSVATAAAVGDPGPAQSPLNHEFIRRVLVDVGDVAKMFHAGGWHHAASELERAAAAAWELGSALKAGGL